MFGKLRKLCELIDSTDTIYKKYVMLYAQVTVRKNYFLFYWL